MEHKYSVELRHEGAQDARHPRNQQAMFWGRKHEGVVHIEEGLDMCFAGNKMEVPERQCSNLKAI